MPHDHKTDEKEQEKRDRLESIVRRDHELYTSFEESAKAKYDELPNVLSEDLQKEDRLYTTAHLFAQECIRRSEDDYSGMRVDDRSFESQFPPEEYPYLYQKLASNRQQGSYYFRIYLSYIRMKYMKSRHANYEAKNVTTRALLTKSLGKERLDSLDEKSLNSIVDLDGLIDMEKFNMQYGLDVDEREKIYINLKQEYGKSGLSYLQNNDFGHQNYYVYGLDEPDTYYVGIDLSLPISVIMKMIMQYKQDVRDKRVLGDDKVLNKKNFKWTKFVELMKRSKRNNKPKGLEGNLADALFIYDALKMGIDHTDIRKQIDEYWQKKMIYPPDKQQFIGDTMYENHLNDITKMIEEHLYREL